MWAISRMVRDANESMTSRAVTSKITPRDRIRTTRSSRAARSWSRSASLKAACTVAIKKPPCFRIGTSTALPSINLAGFCNQDDFIPEQALRLLDTALQIAHRVHLAQVHSYGHQSLGNLGRQSRNNYGRAQQPG